MKHSILLVDDVVEVTESLSRMLGKHFDVVTANSAAEAFEAAGGGRNFSVVVSDDHMPGVKGAEFLNRFAEQHPATVRIMLTGMEDQDVAVQALNRGGVFRFLRKPFSYEGLRSALDDAIAEHERLARELQEAEELRFSNESLQTFSEKLERRIAEQSATLIHLHHFAVDLNTASSLDEVAAMTAETASEALGNRGTHVQIWDLESPGIGIEAGAGPEMSTEMHRHVLGDAVEQIGEIVVDLKDPLGNELTDTDKQLLDAIGSSAAVAARNEFRRRERDRAQHATIVALARLAEQRDNETGKHLERVALYCKLIAEGLRERGYYQETVTDDWIEDLVRSSPLHDIGKVGIPDSILLKPGKLTPEEWVIMKTHSEIGAATIDSVIREAPEHGFLHMARDIAWAHHEKWSGEGYPRGLKEQEIPLAARILALADVYDALTSVRPYKAAWTHEAALEWIQGESGSHFDPVLVEVLMLRERQADRVRERLADDLEEVADKVHS